MHTQYTSNKQYTCTHTRHIHTHNTHNTYIYRIYVDTQYTWTHYMHGYTQNIYTPNKQGRLQYASTQTIQMHTSNTHAHLQCTWHTYTHTIHMHTHKPHTHSQYLCSLSTHAYIHIHTQSHVHTLTSADQCADRWTCGGVFIYLDIETGLDGSAESLLV